MTSPIIQRWEWRTFADQIGQADAILAGQEPTGIQESDELYLVSGDEGNVKIRDGRMDIKLLRATDAHGLERWEPVLKADFPLPPDAVIEVVRALGVSIPTGRPSWTLEDLLADLAASPARVRVVPVHKRRVRHIVGGCTAEITDVIVDGRAARTIAIESDDAAAVLAAVRSVGLAGYRNTGYPRGLRTLVEGTPDRYAVIDTGTNSVKLHVAERAPDGGWRTVIDRVEITRLGEGLAASGTIAPAALDRTATVIGEMAREADAAGAVALVAVGTAGLRMARDRDAALATIWERTGVEIEVISGEEESRLAYVAVAAALPAATGTAVVFDTGGGSSQFTFGDGPVIRERFSLDLGAARITERFGLDAAVDRAVVDAALVAITDELGRLRGRPRPDALVGMGGAVTNLTAVALGMTAYDPDAIGGAVLERDEVDRQIEQYRSLDADGRRAIPGLQPKRAEVILAGACIVRSVMGLLGHDRTIVSDRGLRHGVLAERFGAPLGEDHR